MNHKLYIFIVAFSVLQIGVAQTDSNFPITTKAFEVGYLSGKLQDQNTTPLIYAINAAYLGFEHKKQKQQFLRSFYVDLAVGSNQSERFGRREIVTYDFYSIAGKRDSSVYDLNPAISFIQFELGYSFLKKLDAKEVYVGADVSNIFTYSGLAGDTYFLNQTSFSPKVSTKLFSDTESRLTAEASIPIFSVMVSKPFAEDPSLAEPNYTLAFLETGTQLATLNKFQQLNFSLNFKKQIIEKRTIGLKYQLMWMNYTRFADKNLRFYTNSISFQYEF